MRIFCGRTAQLSFGLSCFAIGFVCSAAAPTLPTPLPIHQLVPSTTHTYAGGTPLEYGINLIAVGNIGDTVSLPPATGTGQEIDIHVLFRFFRYCFAEGDRSNQPVRSRRRLWRLSAATHSIH